MKYGNSMMYGKKPLPLESGVLANIGNLLREMYDSALREPVPQRFLDLLRQMDAGTDGPPAAPAERAGPPPASASGSKRSERRD
jgi:hypothetical protein